MNIKSITHHTLLLLLFLLVHVHLILFDVLLVLCLLVVICATLSIDKSVCLPSFFPPLSLYSTGLVDWFHSELRFNSATHPDLLRSKHDEYFITKKKKKER